VKEKWEKGVIRGIRASQILSASISSFFPLLPSGPTNPYLYMPPIQGLNGIIDHRREVMNLPAIAHGERQHILDEQ